MVAGHRTKMDPSEPDDPRPQVRQGKEVLARKQAGSLGGQAVSVEEVGRRAGRLGPHSAREVSAEKRRKLQLQVLMAISTRGRGQALEGLVHRGPRTWKETWGCLGGLEFLPRCHRAGTGAWTAQVKDLSAVCLLVGFHE